jgi:hypothetical protein
VAIGKAGVMGRKNECIMGRNIGYIDDAVKVDKANINPG